jgi:hypothetical protein
VLVVREHLAPPATTYDLHGDAVGPAHNPGKCRV